MRYLVFLLIFLYPVSVHAESIAQRVSGRIVLDVLQNGEAWYVDPIRSERSYLSRADDAFSIMRTFGLGISEKDFARFNEDLRLRQRLAGRILLQVEKHGEAWYVHPETLKKHYLGRPDFAYALMREQSLGITSADLSTIPISSSNTSFFGMESYINMAFVPQAPFGEWSDPRQQDACEEASVFMAVKWARGETFTFEEARNAFVAMSDWEKEKWGYFEDTSANDSMVRLFKEWFGFESVSVYYDISTLSIREELKNGNAVVVPINGQKLGNLFYQNGGPERHMIVIVGFDSRTNEFVIKDPGTYRGNDLRFSETAISASLRDYASGNHSPIGDGKTAMIVIKK